MIVIFFSSSYCSGEFRLIDGIIKSYSWQRDQKCIFGNKAKPIEWMEWFFLLRDNSSSSPPGNMMMRWWSSSVGQLQRDTEQGDGFCWSFDSCNIKFVIVNRFVMVICTTPPLLSSWTQHICAWARDLPLVFWASGMDRGMGDAQLRNEIFLYHPNDRLQKASNSFGATTFLSSLMGPDDCLLLCAWSVSPAEEQENSSLEFSNAEANQGNYFRFNLSPNLTLLLRLHTRKASTISSACCRKICVQPTTCSGQLLYLFHVV